MWINCMGYIPNIKNNYLWKISWKLDVWLHSFWWKYDFIVFKARLAFDYSAFWQHYIVNHRQGFQLCKQFHFLFEIGKKTWKSRVRFRTRFSQPIGSCSVWKFHNFSISLILREINFGDSRSAKYAIIPHLGALKIDFFYDFLHFLKAEMPKS